MDNVPPVCHRLDYEKLISVNGLNCSQTGEHIQTLLLNALYSVDYALTVAFFHRDVKQGF